MNKHITIELTDSEYSFYQGFADYINKGSSIESYVIQTLKIGMRECKQISPILYRRVVKNGEFINLIKDDGKP